ncbi:MAG: MarR family winged helix-turn-helix transcriptional regulator [Collimonas sp.]|uniref:MarR family winged helix-turn-helix transcriptional regulator n=1 Tax=Collimonas sp. TaxID=1963772 RepID=UPI003267001E
MSELDLSLLKRVAVECPGFQARATARALTRFYNGCFKPLGLTAEQFSLLVGVGATHRASVVDLAASAGVDATTLSRGVQALQQRGLVEAEGGRGRAGKRLSLTLSGLALMNEALPVWERAKASLSHRLGEATLRATRQAMMDLAEAVAVAEADPASP